MRIAGDAADRTLCELRHDGIRRPVVVSRMQVLHRVARFGIRQQADIRTCEPLAKRGAARGVGLDEQRGDRRTATIEAMATIGHHHHAAARARLGPVGGLHAEAAFHRQRYLDRMRRMVLDLPDVAADPHAPARPADHAADPGDGSLA